MIHSGMAEVLSNATRAYASMQVECARGAFQSQGPRLHMDLVIASTVPVLDLTEFIQFALLKACSFYYREYHDKT